jgi:hypothetical protein
MSKQPKTQTKNTENQVALKAMSIEFTYHNQRHHFELPQEFRSFNN